jgi:UDP-N-acetylmuramate dehydrogenase
MDIRSKITENRPLKELSTYKIGGPAKYYFEVSEKEDLPLIYEWAKKEEQTIFLLGGGSNVLINSKGVDGLVIKMKNDKIKVCGDRIECGAGADLNSLLRAAVNEKLSGLEWVAGIPGATIGGTIRGNGGAFGKNISDIIETVEVFNTLKNKFEIFSRKDCKFGYRESVFKANSSYVIWNAVLKLHKAPAKQIIELNEKNLNARNNFQPKLPSAGCVFKNLYLSDIKKENSDIARLLEKENVAKDGKIGAGWLIDRAGLKGKSIGGAKVSLEHANFIVNTSNASSSDIVMLISIIKQKIRQLYKIQLQEEIQYIGF